MQQTGWKMDKLLLAMPYLFDGALVRRADYKAITKSQVFEGWKISLLLRVALRSGATL